MFDSDGEKLDATSEALHVLAYGQSAGVNKVIKTDRQGRLTLPYSVDNADRLRTSQPYTELEMTHTLNHADTTWSENIHYTVGASGTTIDNFYLTDSMVGLEVDTVDSYRRHSTKQKVIYHPGKSTLVKITGCLNARSGGNDANCHTMIGLYDGNDGIFYEHNDTSGYVVVRRNGVDTKVVQDSWNLDTMDGNGGSGATIDWTKTQYFVFDFQWQGVGNINYSVLASGELIPVHTSLHANTTSGTFMKWGNLPIRYETSCNSITTSNNEMTMICATVISEGGGESIGHPHSAYAWKTGTSFGGDGNGAAIQYHALSLRINPSHALSSSNIFFDGISSLVSTKDYGVFVYYTPLQQTPPVAGVTWTDVSYSCMQYGTTSGGTKVAVDATNSILVHSKWVSAESASSLSNISELAHFGTDITDTSSDILTIAIGGLGIGTAGGATVDWHESI